MTASRWKSPSLFTEYCWTQKCLPGWTQSVLGLVIIALTTLLATAPSLGGTANDSRDDVQQTDSAAQDDLHDKQQEVSSQLRVAMLQEKQSQEAESEGQPLASAAKVDQLKQLDAIVAQQKAAQARLDDLRAEADKQQNQEGRGPEEQSNLPKRNVSLLLLDQWDDTAASLRIRKENAGNSVAAARDALEAARQTVDLRGRELRQAREEAGQQELTEDAPAVLESQIADELLVLRRIELEAEEVALETTNAQLKLVNDRLAVAGDTGVLSQADLDAKLQELDQLDAELRRQVTSTQSELQFAERRWLAARQEVDLAGSPTEGQVTMVSALKVRQQAFQSQVAILNQRLQYLPAMKDVWRRRFAMTNRNVTREQRRSWMEELLVLQADLERDRNSRRLKIEEVRAMLTTTSATLETLPDADAQNRRWLQASVAAYSDQISQLESSLTSLTTFDRLLQRLQFQIEGKRGRTLGEWAADAWALAESCWNYELTSIDDHSVTVGRVCSSVLLLFLGYFLAKFLSRLLANKLPRLGVDEAGAHAIESLSFYVLLIGFGLGALRYSSVPLTVFTFLGGAIAIGVGFGSQNILNNFISGLILLAERPIKVGDLIEIDGMHGTVRRIGARSTSIQTGDNLDIIVPNSKFLENNVTNLTRKDDRLRTSITIGVAYGSDLDAVLRLLARAAMEQSGVLERPKPMVWFNDFGDNSLVFQVHFWVRTKTISQMRMIETGVRLRIDAMFREADIVIAFPQRDLHLHTSRPIDMRLLRSELPDSDAA